MRILRVALLLAVLPVFAFGKDAPALEVGKIWRSKDASRTLRVRSDARVELREGDVSAIAPMKVERNKIIVEPSLFGQTVRIVLHRVDDVIVCPDNVKLYPSAKLTKRDRIEQAKRQLAFIGKHLKAMENGGKLKFYSGAAFLLQIRDRLSDEELDVFRGVLAEGPVAEKPLDEFRKEIREVDLVQGLDDWCSAYAGPNWRQFPQARAGENQRRVWACDRCSMGFAPHDGIVLLWNDLTVEFVPIGKLKGADPKIGLVRVGPNSPDERLKTMTYYSR